MSHFNKPFLVTLGLGLLGAGAARAQTGVGTGSTAPRTMLDVNGAIAVTETTAAVSANAATIPTGYSLVRLTGTATATVALTGASTPAPVAGQQLTIFNTTSFAATFGGQTIPATSALAFVYTNGGWQGSAGGANGLTATNGLTKTGNAIGLGGTLGANTDIATGGFNTTFSGTGNLTTGGRIGIGTTTPTTKLDVVGSATYREAAAVAVTGTSVAVAALTNSQFRLTGSPSDDFVVTGPTTSDGTTALVAGARLLLVNATNQQATLNKTTIPANQAVDFTYTGSAWVAANSYSTTSQAMMRANTMMTGGGTTTYIGNNLLWDQRFIIISSGNGSHFSTSGYFDINMPAVGTVIPGVGGSANVTTTAAGIPLADWQALYYELPIGGNNASLDANFRVANYTSGMVIPENWVLVAARNGDNGTVKLGTEQILYATQSSNGCLPTQNQTVASGATTTYTLSKTQGVLTIAGGGNGCGRYWVAFVAYNTRTNVLTLAPGGYGSPDAPSANPTSGQSIQIQNSAGGCADGQGPNQPGLFSLSGQMLTYTNQRNVSINMSVRECDANASNQSASVQNIYSTDGTLTAPRTVTQGANSLTFAGAGNLLKTGSGYLGLGTATPGAKLHLVTTGGAGGADDDLNLESYSGTGADGGNIIFRHSRGTLAAPANLASGDFALALDSRPYYNGGFQPVSSFLYSNYVGSGTNNLTNLRLGTSGAERVRISETGNVGIGLTAPITALDVNGAGLFRNGGVSNATTGNEQLLFGYAGANNYQHAIRSRHNDAAQNGNALDFYLWNYGTDAATAIGTKQVMTLNGNGNVGIGTTVPYSQLANTSANIIGADAIGANTGSLNWAMSGTNGYAGLFYNGFNATQGNGLAVKIASSLSTTTALDVSQGTAQATAGTSLFNVKGNGYVGVGTSAPGAKLHMVTTGGAGGADDDLNLESYSGTGADGGNIIFRHSRGTLAAPSNLAAGDVAFAIDARPYYNGAFQGVSSALYSYYKGSGTTNLTDLRFITSGNEQMRLNENGYLGIGTTTPASRLHIVADNSDGGPTDDIILSSFGTNAGPGMSMSKARGTVAAPVNMQNGDFMGVYGLTGRYNNAPGVFSLSGMQGFYQGDGTTALSDLRLVTSNTERMRIDQNGNVGIGTTAPTSPLHIGSTGWSANQLHFSSGWGTGGYHATIGSGYTGTTAGGIMLGTPHIPWRASYGAKFRFASDQAATNYWDMGMNAEGSIGTTDRFDINRQGVNLFTITNAGRVGIGTTNPAGKLHVEDNVNGPTFSYVRNLNAGTGAYSIHALGNDGAFSTVLFLNSSTRTADGGTNTATLRNDAGDLRIQGGSPSLGSSGIIVKGTSNNVGIGTSTPVNTLHLDNGAANSGTSFLINNNGPATTGALPFGTANRDGIQAIVAGTALNSELYIQRSSTNSNMYLSKNSALGTVTNGDYVDFFLNGSIQGSIKLNGTSGVTFNTTSDIRLKENIRPTTYGLTDVMKVQVRDYNYKADKATPQTGFLAQQLYQVFPVAVTKGGDDAKTNPWTVDYSKLTPLLTKAIQEEQTEIEALKAEVATLKAANTKLQAQVAGSAQSQAELQSMKASLESLSAVVRQLQASTASASLK